MITVNAKIIEEKRRHKERFRWEVSVAMDGKTITTIVASKIKYNFIVGNSYRMPLDKSDEENFYIINPNFKFKEKSTVPRRTSEGEKAKNEEELDLEAGSIGARNAFMEETDVDSDIESYIDDAVEQEENIKATRQLSNKLELIIPEESKLQLTSENVKKYLCPAATNQEIYMFMQLCINQGLNPFIKDAYLIKYAPGKPATMVVSKDAFLKKAEQIGDYRGLKAGIVVLKKGGEIERREGSMKLKDEQLIGGWANIFRKGMEIFSAEISFDEYNSNQSSWKKIPCTMIRKVAIVQALREAFPMNFQGMYDKSEIDAADEMR